MAVLWTQKQDVGPAGRTFPAMTFDASRERVVLFGGQVVLFGGAGAPPAGAGDFPRLGDTWETFDPAAPSPVT
jgi:hypothetical protein